MIQELIIRIDKTNFATGLANARERGEYDTWHQFWRIPFTVAVEQWEELYLGQVRPGWLEAVALCDRLGWVAVKLVDPANRGINWSSPQFPTPGVTHYPICEV